MKKILFAAVVMAAAAASAATASLSRADAPESVAAQRRDAAGCMKCRTPFMAGIFSPVQFPCAGMDVVGLRLNLPYAECVDFAGLDLGVANIVPGDAEALQIGLFNCARGISGLQIGIVNVADRMEGVQIGLVNVICHSDVAFFPVVNFWF